MYQVAVVGGGVIGLTSALSILNELKGSVKVCIYTESLSPNTTGDVSAGLWTPYLLGETDLGNVIKWSKATQDLMLQLMKQGYANEAGIIVQPVVVLSESEIETPKEIIDIAIGFHYISEKELRTINSRLNKNFKSGYVYVSVSMQVTRLLPFLQKKFIASGGKIVIKNINSLEELSSYDLVVNCAGLNAKTLTGDENLVPIRGQVCRVKAPWLFYSYLGTDKTYVIVNCDNVILGGTAQYGNYSMEIDVKDKESILNRCYQILPALKNTSVLNDSVGLRPGRVSVRLDLEIKNFIDKKLKIIHNYGHGGAGVTLSHGCSLDVAKIAKIVLLSPHKL